MKIKGKLKSPTGKKWSKGEPKKKDKGNSNKRKPKDRRKKQDFSSSNALEKSRKDWHKKN